MEKYLCENCGKVFFAYARHRRGKHVFCSMKCQHEWRTGKTGLIKKKGVYKNCPICGKVIYCYPCEAEKKATCSRPCKYELERIQGIHQGENCNFWHGGYENYRGAMWYEQRDRTRERDNNTCQVCGKTAQEQGHNMIVHHKVPFRFFRNDYIKANNLDNLMCMCHNCHAKSEAHHWTVVPGEYKYLLQGIDGQCRSTKGNRYTNEERDFVINNYADLGPRKTATILNRPISSVVDKAMSLGVSCRKSNWTKSEIDILEKYYPVSSDESIKLLLPNKKMSAIRSYANRNKIYKQRRYRAKPQ